MFLAMVALMGLMQFQSAPIDELQLPTSMQTVAGPAGFGNFYTGGRIDMRSPLSGSVLVAQAIHAGRLRVPYLYRPQPWPFVLSCSPAPCVTPNVRASEGGSPVDETPIAVNPANPLRMLSGGNDYNCASLQGFFATRNGGTTWNHTCMNTLAGAGGFGDPAVGYDTRGNAYIMGLDGSGSPTAVAFEKSANNGVTWSAPGVAAAPISPYNSVDKEWLQIDDTLTSPRKNALYVSMTQFASSNNSAIAVSHSTNGGGTWKNVVVDAVVYPIIDQFSDLAIGKDGTVYLSWMRCSATGTTGDCGGTRAMILFSKSTNGGVSWSAPVTVAMANLAPDSCGAFYGCLPNTSERVSNVPAIDVDRSSGAFSNRLYVSFYNWNGSKMQVQVAKSKTGGATWARPVKVAATSPGDQFFPWLTTGSTGTVGVTWLDRRLDPANINYDAVATTSVNGGVSFGPSVRMSSVSSNPFNDGFSGSFMGDYTGNIWAGNVLFASWTDTRSNIAQDEVGGYLP